MLYHDHLKASPQDKHCPFCHFEEKNIITQSKYFYITFARAPYAPDHILIIPKRHVILLKELKKAERKELRSLTEERNEKLKQNHTSTSILIRDTLPGEGFGKSIGHLHLHIVPDCFLGKKNLNERKDREYLSEDAYTKQVEKMRKRYCNTPPPKHTP